MATADSEEVPVLFIHTPSSSDFMSILLKIANFVIVVASLSAIYLVYKISIQITQQYTAFGHGNTVTSGSRTNMGLQSLGSDQDIRTIKGSNARIPQKPTENTADNKCGGTVYGTSYGFPTAFKFRPRKGNHSPPLKGANNPNLVITSEANFNRHKKSSNDSSTKASNLCYNISSAHPSLSWTPPLCSDKFDSFNWSTNCNAHSTSGLRRSGNGFPEHEECFSIPRNRNMSYTEYGLSSFKDSTLDFALKKKESDCSTISYGNRSYPMLATQQNQDSRPINKMVGYSRSDPIIIGFPKTPIHASATPSNTYSYCNPKSTASYNEESQAPNKLYLGMPRRNDRVRINPSSSYYGCYSYCN